MDKSVTDLLNCLLKSVGVINEMSPKGFSIADIKNSTGFQKNMHEIRHLYEGMPEHDRNQFYQVIGTEFRSEVPLYIYLLSIMLSALHKPQILDRIFQKIYEHDPVAI
jgi:hypothetical protein